MLLLEIEIEMRPSRMNFQPLQFLFRSIIRFQVRWL